MKDEQLAFDFARQSPPDAAVAFLPQALVLRERLRKLAEHQVHIGTSSWKYPGWLGQVYNPARYQTRGRLSPRRFKDECLAEYAAIFPTVCGDFAFYQFPTAEFWHNTFAQVSEGFRFAFKVPEDITVERFPDLPRYGSRAGKQNPHFLDASLLRSQFLDALESYRDRLGPLIFEFGTFHTGPMREASEFAARLERFLEQLPTTGFLYAVEVRNPEFLDPDGRYLACLREHSVAHCLNSWTRMPPILEQTRIPGILTAPYGVLRMLLRPGRTYEQAVKQFAPYDRVQDPYPEGRDALAELIQTHLSNHRPLYVFVNNRFEGNAIETIEITTRPHE